MPKGTPGRAPCSFDGCGRDSRVFGLCDSHAKQIRRGKPLTAITTHGGALPGSKQAWRGDNIGYYAAHYRVRSRYGRAVQYLCICRKPALQWAYYHTDPNEKRETTGKQAGKPYSPDPTRYVAMCGPCHYAFDKARSDDMQPASVRNRGTRRSVADRTEPQSQ